MHRAFVHRDGFLALFLTGVTAAVFIQVAGFDFVAYDDNLYVTENYRIRAGFTDRDALIASFKPSIGLWHPVTWLSHMLDCQLYGLRPRGHHVSSLMLHVANTLLLFYVLKRMTGRSWRSGFVAALFAVHPLHVEAVAWVSSRKDLLCALFWLLTVLAYARYVEHPSIFRYAMVCAGFLLSVMSKAMAITLPFTLLLLDHWPLQRVAQVSDEWPRRQWRSLVREKQPLFAVSLLLALLTFYAARTGGSLRSSIEVPLDARLANAPVHYVQYLWRMVWPFRLTACYPLLDRPVPVWQTVGALVFLTYVTYGACVLARRFSYLVMGWLWFLVTLTPVIGVVPVGGQGTADRYTYITLTGPFIILVWGMCDLLGKRKWGRGALAVLGCLVLSVLTPIAWAQTRYWRDSISLFSRMIEVSPDNSTGHTGLGEALLAVGQYEAAVRHLRKALQISPDHPEAHVNLGLALAALGKKEEAMGHYLAALKQNPASPTAHNNLGVILIEQGRPDEAMAHYQAALDKMPDYPDALTNMGNALLARGCVDDAIGYYHRAITLDPKDASAWCNLGGALVLKGRSEEAVEVLNKALRLKSDDVLSLVNLAVALDNLGRRQEAILQVREALGIDPGSQRARALLEYLEAQR